MDAFIDAAFAFAVTLLIIAVDAVPDSIEGLRDALRGVPAFAASFAMVAWIWRGHANWSRRYGMDDATSGLLSLLLVFLVLVFVYPLRMLFASAFHSFSGGLLAAGVLVRGVGDLQWLYLVYAGAFGLLGGVLWLHYAHAWKHREQLQLDQEERIQTRLLMCSWACLPAVAVVSALLTAMLPAFGEPGPAHGLPGMCYGLLALQWPLLAAYQRRLRKRGA